MVGRLAVVVVAVFGVTLVTAPPGYATTVPSNPTGVSTSVTASTATITWSPPASTGGAAITGYFVARDGTDRSGGGRYSTVKIATTGSFTFTMMVPGVTYHLSVAAQNSAGRGDSVVKTITIPGTGLPTALSAQIRAVNGSNPLYAGSYNGSAICNIYHFNDQVCGETAISFETKGFTSATSGGFWVLSADTSRTFGCYTKATNSFKSLTVLNKRFTFNQYGYWEGGRVAVQPDGTSTNYSTYFFSDPDSFGGTNDMPAPYICAAGAYAAQYGLHVSNIQATLYGAFPGNPGTPLLGVITVPGRGYSPPPVFP